MNTIFHLNREYFAQIDAEALPQLKDAYAALDTAGLTAYRVNVKKICRPADKTNFHRA